MGKGKVKDEERKFPMSISLTLGQRKHLIQLAENSKDVSTFIVSKCKIKNLPLTDSEKEEIQKKLNK